MKQDLTGRRYGKLTVVSRNPQTEDHYHTWNCRCDCGGEITVNTKRLTRGTVTNCGCIPKTKQHRADSFDLTGKVFGSLTVLERAENKGKSTTWRCRCECGNETVVFTGNLLRGRTKSCGCKAHENVCHRELAGERIGRLTVIKKTDERDYKGSVLWQCHCDCGNDVLFSADTLLHGNIKSCGCYRKKEIREKINKTLHRVDGTCIERLNLKKARSDNKSGHIGVHKINENAYQATIGFKGKRYYLGTFSTLEEAIKARRRGEQMHLDFLEEYYSKREENDA